MTDVYPEHVGITSSNLDEIIYFNWVGLLQLESVFCLVSYHQTKLLKQIIITQKTSPPPPVGERNPDPAVFFGGGTKLTHLPRLPPCAEDGARCGGLAPGRRSIANDAGIGAAGDAQHLGTMGGRGGGILRQRFVLFPEEL